MTTWTTSPGGALLAAAAALALVACSSHDSSEAGDAAPPAGEGQGPPSNAASVDELPEELPRFEAPEGWVREAPSSSMRVHQFRLPGEDGAGDATVAVFSFPMGVGPREANLDRWAGQMGLTTPAADLAPEQRWETDVRHFMVTTLHLEGAFTDMGATEAKTDQAMLASWIELPGEPAIWNVKATGPKATIDRWKDSYMAFIASL